ncbi:MAG: neutral/alkaline non-lysosomal ceramidase N-terminal domain-containing protein [Verrucomicrobia bacterium]|nr:neutral/alkaline non-lysosomal ceramidase N-terminal domain-containing protein [Verrucomicrobiota bacterium]
MHHWFAIPLRQRLRARGLGLTGLLAIFLQFFSPGPARAVEEILRAGAARIDITPDAPVTLAGYASRKELSRGVHDPLSARAVAFERSGKRLVLVSTDILGFYNGTAAAFRRAILEQCHLQPSELFLAAIHTHSAPTPVLDPATGHSNNVAYTQSLQAKLVRVVGEALERSSPVTLEAGSGASPVGASRRQLIDDPAGNPKVILGRNPSVMIDREVQVLKISRTGSADPMAVLFAYNTHSTSLGPRNYLVSGDVHGLAEQFVERFLGPGVVAPGFAAPSGNIDPWYRVLPGFRTTNGWIPEPVLLGTLLGEEVVRTLEGIKPEDLGGPIATIFETFDLPGKPEGVTRTTNNCPPTPLNLTVGRVGQIGFVGIGGEVFNEIGQAIKTASPFPRTVVITHCNGAAGYLPIRQAYLEGGYEVESSPFAPSAADLVIREVLRLLNAL